MKADIHDRDMCPKDIMDVIIICFEFSDEDDVVSADSFEKIGFNCIDLISGRF